MFSGSLIPFRKYGTKSLIVGKGHFTLRDNEFYNQYQGAPRSFRNTPSITLSSLLFLQHEYTTSGTTLEIIILVHTFYLCS